VGLRIVKPEWAVDGLRYFSVECESVEANARVRVYHDDSGRPLSGYFRELAIEWPWTGEKTWGSLEGEVGFSATADSLGHITLLIALVPDPYPRPWEFTGRAALEAGQLDALARSVEEFFQPPI
jgi:uncharacterized protein DUF6228